MKSFLMIVLLANGGCIEDVAEAADIELAKEQMSTLYPDSRIVGYAQIA